MVSSADDAITSACNRHFCSLECCIVGGRETSVCRRPAQRRIGQVTADDGAQLVQFVLRVLCRWTSLFANNCFHVTLFTFHELHTALQHGRQEVVAFDDFLAEFIL